jgi:hypothetical protein
MAEQLAVGPLLRISTGVGVRDLRHVGGRNFCIALRERKCRTGLPNNRSSLLLLPPHPLQPPSLLSNFDDFLLFFFFSALLLQLFLSSTTNPGPFDRGAQTFDKCCETL